MTTLLDFLPLLWLLALILALALLRRGARALPARVLPAAALALAGSLSGLPPRRQSLLFLALWLFAAVVTAAAQVLRRRRTARRGG